MAIWIDNNAYRQDCDYDTLYQYIFHIVIMPAAKSKYFHTNKDYDDFGIFAASYYFNRLRNEKQFSDDKKLDHIKSILNYIKKTIYAVKCLYMKQFFQENISNDVLSKQGYEDAIDYIEYYKMCDNSNILGRSDFTFYLEDIPRTIKNFLQSIPKKRNSCEWHNIYLSCLLSYINIISLSKKQEDALQGITRSDQIKENLYSKFFNDIDNSYIVLYNLPESYRDYIYILVLRVKNVIRDELESLLYAGFDYRDVLYDYVYGKNGDLESTRDD